MTNTKFNSLVNKHHVRTTRIGHLGGGKTLIHLCVKGAILGAEAFVPRKIEASHIEYSGGNGK